MISAPPWTTWSPVTAMAMRNWCSSATAGAAMRSALWRHRTIISVAGVNSAMDAVIEPAADAVGPLAYVNYPFLWLYQSLLFDYETANLEVSELLNSTEIPTLIIHGVADETVSHDAHSVMAHRAEIQSDSVRFLSWEESGARGHVDILYDADGTANEELMAEIAAFIDKETN